LPDGSIFGLNNSEQAPKSGRNFLKLAELWEGNCRKAVEGSGNSAHEIHYKKEKSPPQKKKNQIINIFLILFKSWKDFE
jgi:hypothetical protein